MNTKKSKLTKVGTFHYFRLVLRSSLFLLWALYLITEMRGHDFMVLRNLPNNPVVLSVVWFIFVFEMVFRFFPSPVESPGCQKQFKKNYIKTGKTDIVIPDNNAVVLVALIWIIMNAIIGALKMSGVIGDGMMVLVSLFYSVCDLICILFFCPFQTWFLKNKCCASCRIYNWDYAMMFTPLFFVKGWFSWSLVGLSLALLLRWEITFYKHPERFSEKTNGYLSCKNCSEKLCQHKKQLHVFWRDLSEFTQKRAEMLKISPKENSAKS